MLNKIKQFRLSKTRILILLVLFLITGAIVLHMVGLFQTPVQAQSTTMTVWAVNNTVKVRTPIAQGDWWPYYISQPQHTNPIWDSSSQQINIASARNEREGFQLIVSAEHEGLQGVTIHLGSLTQGTSVISPDNIELLLTKYVYAPHASDNNINHYPPWDSQAQGYWPDPLPPLTGSFNVNDGENQPVWINLKVPKGTPAGNYTADITVTANNAPSETLHLNLRVWDFDLPDKFHMRTHYAIDCHFEHSIPELFNVPVFEYPFDETDPWPTNNPPYSTEYKQIAKQMLEILAEYHMSPRWYLPQLEDFTRNGTNITIDWTDIDQWLDDLYVKYNSNAFAMGWGGEAGGASHFDYPFGHNEPNYQTVVTDYMSQLVNHYRSRGMIEDTYVYFDEPADENQVEYYVDRLHAIDPDIKVLVAGGSDLNGKVDIIAGNWLGDDERIAQLHSRGVEVWKYVCNYPPYPHAAYWLDHPAIEHRILKWQCRKYGVTGFLYWGVESWHDWDSTGISVWDQVRGEGSDGFLFYPGTPDRGYNNIPIKSVRLEVAREGLEDYEYFVLLEQLGDGLGEQTIDQIVTNFAEFERDADKLYQARNTLGNRIEELISGTPRPYISLSKSSNKSQTFSGDQITYTIHYQNIGQTQVQNVLIQDNIPPGSTYVQGSADPLASLNGQTLTWNLGSLTAGGQGKVEFKVKVN